MFTLDLNMQIGKTQRRNMRHNTTVTQNQKGKNKYRLDHTHTHTDKIKKIRKIILGRDILDRRSTGIPEISNQNCWSNGPTILVFLVSVYVTCL